MRYIVAALIAALISTTVHGQDRNYVHSWGTHSCGKYLAAVHGHPPGASREFNHPQQGKFSDDHALYKAWLGGFFSAMNWFTFKEPIQIQDDGAAIDVWIRKWCEQNPTKGLVEAAAAFVWDQDQRKKYLQGWHRIR
jgi:hypothetical protein